MIVMKLKAILAIPAIVLLFSSCIKEAAPSLEADILSITFEEDPELKENPMKGASTITLVSFDESINLTSLTPIIKISPNAKIEPQSGIPQNFSESKPVKYVVTSESGDWKAEYFINIKKMQAMYYNFEEWTTAGIDKKYPVLADGQWSSGNQGVAIVKSGPYPTESTTDAYMGGFAAKLETQKGGEFYKQLIPVFAGSLFKGQFLINRSDFPKSPRFGQPHPKEAGRPVKFKGFYKYKPGDTFYNEKNQIVEGAIDKLSIYSVLYKITKGSSEYLDGTNIQSSDKIVAKAEVKDKSAKSVYTEFDLDFVYTEEPDYNNYDYKLAIVFSSSEEGDFYRGAVGSCLIIDEVEVVCEAY